MTEELLQAALAYASRGWPVFPCRADKTPWCSGGVLEATTDEGILRAWWARWPGANVALSVGDAGLLVLDLDPGGSWAEVEARLGEPLPATALVAKSPRGGEHRYHVIPAGADPVPNSVGRLAPHVDVRSFHGYVLLPPSRTADGGYSWVEDGKPGRAGDKLLEACRAGHRDKDPLRDEWLVEADLPENVERAAAWLRKEARVAVEGSMGDATTYATAAMLKSFGLSEGRATEALWEHWNDRCSPPWEYDDLAAKVENAYRYNTSPPGNLTPAYHAARVALEFQPVVEKVGEGGARVEAGRFRFVDRAGIEAIPPPEWLIPEFLTEGGYAFLTGRRGSFKTFLAFDAALTIASGGVPPWEDGKWEGAWDQPARPGPVLYVAGEGRPGLRQRVRAWERLHLGGRTVDDLVLGDPVPRVLDGADPLRQFVEGALRLSEDGYRLVVFDTVGRAMQGVNENAQEHASAFTALVEHVQRGLGAAVLAVHHTGHENQERGRGSSVFEADCDTIVMVGRPEDGRYVKMTMTKQKDAAEWEQSRWAEAVTINLAPGEQSLATRRAVRADAEEAAVAAGGRPQLAFELVDARVVEVLRAHPLREMSNADLARKVASWRPETGPGERGEPLGVGEQAVRKTWLPRLRTEACASRDYYDPGKDRWRYSKGGGE